MPPSHDTVSDDAGPDGFAPDTPLPRLFGDNARVKIIAALLSEREHDLNVSDMARLADVARSTVYDHIDELQRLGIVVQTRKVSGAPMYQIDTDDEIVEHLEEIQWLAMERLED
jgi:DNA-binding transcriptional ArsR family regulator